MNDIERFNFWNLEMEDISKKKISVNAIKAIGEKFAQINKHIEAGEEIPAELSKNFITVPLVDDPYSAL